MSAPAFTVSQIAAALGKTPRAVRSSLDRAAANGAQIVRGKATPAWTFEAIPERLRGELLRRLERSHLQTVVELLEAPAARWESPVPLAQVPEESLARAQKLCRAFAGTLERLNDTSIPEADFRARGLADYKAIFGYAISEKQWRRWLDRIVQRDNGAEEWQRLEIYLDENCGRRAPVNTTAAVVSGAEHQPLRDLIASFKKAASPDKTECVLLWQAAFDRFGDLTAGGMSERAARRSLVDFLTRHAPSLAANRHAMHAAFNHKLAKWKAGSGVPAALSDARNSANKGRAPDISAEDRNTILAFAAKHGGGLSQGWRAALDAGALSAGLTTHYIENPASKSYVPRAIRNALGNDLKSIDDWMHGPRQAKLGGAYIERDPSKISAGDWMQGDDLTPPILYTEETADGVRTMRGQFLALIDVRTTFILGFVLISAPKDRPSSYNAWHVRNLITAVHEIYGLPRKGFYFENGNWKAKVLTGNAADWTETETGLRGFGLRFIHARLPRAKVIERVFGLLQNYMESEPGYIGRGWHNDKYERTERAKRFVESGRFTAGDHFHTRDEWMEHLETLVDRYNDEPQDGKYLAGLSPRAAYEMHFGNEPLVKLPDSARYLLANERKRLKVGRNGISFRVGREAFTYKSAETGALIGSSVEVFFNRESPAVLGVKHPQSGEVFAVRRSTLVPAMDADPETLAQAFAENEAHNGYKRALYRAILPKFSEHFLTRPIFRRAVVDGATGEAGRQFAERAAAEKKAATHERKVHQRLSAAANTAGMVMRGPASEERAEAAERLAAALTGTPKPAAPAAKQYAVKESPTPTAAEIGRYFGKWKQAQAARPGLERHALTRRILGHNKPPQQFTREEWRKMMAALDEIASPTKSL